MRAAAAICFVMDLFSRFDFFIRSLHISRSSCIGGVLWIYIIYIEWIGMSDGAPHRWMSERRKKSSDRIAHSHWRLVNRHSWPYVCRFGVDTRRTFYPILSFYFLDFDTIFQRNQSHYHSFLLLAIYMHALYYCRCFLFVRFPAKALIE